MAGIRGVLLIYCILIAVIMRQDYFKAIYPLICMVIILSLYDAGETLLSKNKIRQVIMSIFFIVYIGSSIGTVFAQKKLEEKKVTQLQQALKQADTKELIVLRDHAGGYNLFQLLSRYDRVLFITTTDDDMREYLLSADLQQNVEYTVLVTNGEEVKGDFIDAIEEIDNMSYMEDIYTEAETFILKMKID